jgi:hypothetical protein
MDEKYRKIVTRDFVSSQAANVIDLRSYRERRKARQLADACWTAPPHMLPMPYVAAPFFVGYWPSWVIAPVLMFTAGRPAEARHD